jgi:AraC family transcriptional regulator
VSPASYGQVETAIAPQIQSLGRHDNGELICTDIQYENAAQVSHSTQRSASIVLLLSGSCSGLNSPFAVGFHPAGAPHRLAIGANGAHVFTIELGEPWLDRIGREHFPAGPIIDEHGGDLQWLTLHLYREYSRRANTFCSLAMEGLALQVLATLARQRRSAGQRPAPPWFQKLLGELHASFTRPVTLTSSAASAGVHPVHLARVFRAFTGYTFSEYLHRLRARHTCLMLCDPHLLLSDIAAATGFADQSHLTRVFRSVTGMTPRVFRDIVPRQALPRPPLHPTEQEFHPSLPSVRPMLPLVGAEAR